MSILKLAIEAQLPLISARTDDVPWVGLYLRHITGKVVEQLSIGKLEKDRVYYWLMSGGLNSETKQKLEDPRSLIKMAQKVNSTIVLINCPRAVDSILDVGLIPVEKSLIKAQLVDAEFDPEMIDKLMPSLGGMTLSEILTVVRLTEARDGYLSTEGINKTRRAVIRASKGLELVSPDLDYYMPEKVIAQYAQEEGKFFLGDYDLRLRPRGLLFKGTPGTGKTQGAKYLAKSWGVPLFRLDAGVQSKYVGESENNLQIALGQVDREQPCVFLIDEIEKFFGGAGTDSTGVVYRMLGSLLWWLQEHKTRVFTVMTCNNFNLLPPELYRAGRVDRTVHFNGLSSGSVFPFAEHIAKTFSVQYGKAELADFVGKIPFGPDGVAHATVVEAVTKFVKMKI